MRNDLENLRELLRFADLKELLQDNLLVAFDHLSDEEKTVMCQVVVDTIKQITSGEDK